MRNKYKTEGDVTTLYIDSPKFGRFDCLIDTEDLDKVKKYTWAISKSKSRCDLVRSSKFEYLHRYIMNCPKGFEVDHINFNGLDNRKSNLRICNRSENAQNKQIPRNNKTGVRGEVCVKTTARWV